MSSTNRKNAVKRHVSDYYVTPQSSIKDFLDAFNADFPMGNTLLSILDPCAGGDAKHLMAYPEAISKYSGWNIRKFSTVDIRDDSLAEVKMDYLTSVPDESPYDIVITNPPFNIALDIINRAFMNVKDGGMVIMLLRLNFFGSHQRHDWFVKNPPFVFYIHSKRMKFMDTNSTDSIEYMHCVWKKGTQNKFSQSRVI